MSDVAEAAAIDLQSAVKEILDTVEREREREIIARRFGLYDRKETLEQIGELLGITRERVRQLEKAIMIRLRQAADDDLPHITAIEKHFVRHLHDLGRVAKVQDLATRVAPETTDTARAHVAFIAEIAPRLTVVEENDRYHHAVG